MTQLPYSPAIVYWTKRWAPAQEKLNYQLAAFYICPGVKRNCAIKILQRNLEMGNSPLLSCKCLVL